MTSASKLLADKIERDGLCSLCDYNELSDGGNNPERRLIVSALRAYVSEPAWVPGDDTKVKCETAGNIINDLTIECGIHMCGRITNGVGFWFGRQGSWVLDYEHLKAAYDLATRIRASRDISK